MKFIILIGCLLACIMSTHAQNDTLPNNTIQQIEIHPDSIATFKGGKSEMFKFIGKTVRYPDSAMKKNIEGKIYVQFIVDVNGKISDVHVVKNTSNNLSLEMEALRVVNAFPTWDPAIKNGKPIKSTYQLPITFKLN